MRKRFFALIGLLLVLSVASSAAAAASPYLAFPAARTLVVNLIGGDGSPLKSAEIHLLTPGLPSVKVARADERGQAVLEVPDGFSYWIRVWADGHALIERPYVPASDGPVLTLRADPYTTLLTGIVKDDRGLPVSRAHVNLFREGYGLETSTITNEMGIYSLKNVRSDGSYAIQVEARGFRPVSQELPALNPNSRNQVDIDLTPAAGIITGEVIDAKNNRPLGGVKAELLLNGWGVVQTSTTDPMGYFYLAAPPQTNGVYQVRLSRHLFETTASANFGINPGSWTDFSGTNRLTMNRLYAQISGKVVTPEDSPLADTEVHLQRQGLGTVQVVTTNADGRFKFDQVPSGTYRVRAFPGGDLTRPASDWLDVTGGQDLTATLTAIVPERFHYGSESLSGTVKNHLGDPVPSATVQVHRGADIFTVEADADGRYDISLTATVPNDPDDDPATGYHVIVTAPGYLANDQPDQADQPAPSLIAIQDNADNQANFTLQPETASIVGRVTNDRGQVLAGVKVGLLQEGRSVPLETVTDEVGRYQFPDLSFARQGRFTPIILDSAYVEGDIAPDGAPVGLTTLSPANPTSIALVARPSATFIQGLVHAGSDKPAAKAQVSVARTSDGRTFTTEVLPDGSYQLKIPALPGEQYLVRAGAQGAAITAASAVVDPGTTFGAQVNLTVHPSSTITGRVYGHDGKPVSGTKVALYAEGSAGVARTAITDNTGLYRFTDLAPARRYAVLATGAAGHISALAPGEPIITPLITLPSGETQWADLQIGAPTNP
ncbi:MAG: carboxypeptidase regulatory-like domain-containing protein [Bacillota bacterium]